MKTRILSPATFIVAIFLYEQAAFSQGSVTFVSNLGLPPSGSVPAGSDSWYGADFITGTNVTGYLLNSVQLAMSDPSGSPSGFTVMIYTGVNVLGGTLPGSNIGTLAGSANPSAGGTYGYQPLSSLSLSPNTVYFVVVSAETKTVAGAYQWSITDNASPGYSSYHWGGEVLFAQSIDGTNWNYTSGTYGQFSLNATAAPEPEVVILLAIGGLLIGVKQWNEKKRS